MNKKKLDIVLLLTLIMVTFPVMAFAEPLIEGFSDNLQIHGPVFSMSEPWTLNGFGEKFVAEKYADSVEKLNLVQGKTVKNSAGKAYYLEASKGYDDMGYAILGVRFQENDAQKVVFYFLHPESHDHYRTQLKSWGTTYRTYAHHAIGDVYAGTFDGKPAKFIEFENTFTGEWNCAHPEEDHPKRCMARQYEAIVIRKLFVLGEEGAEQSKILGSGSVSSAVTVSPNEDKSIQNARKKAKSVKAVKKINLDNASCKVNKVKKDYLLECAIKK